MPNPGQATIGPAATGDVVRRLQRALRRTPDLEIRSPRNSKEARVSCSTASLERCNIKSWQARADLAEDFRRRRPPNRLIFMAMRPYWPKETPPSILPPGEGTWQPPGIIASK